MRVITMSQENAETYRPHPGDICISMVQGDHRIPEASLHGWAEVLRVRMPGPSLAPLPDDVSDAIVDLIVRHRETAKLCVIHCLMGFERSPSIAMALEAAGLVEYPGKPRGYDPKGLVVLALDAPHPVFYGCIRDACKDIVAA